MKQTDVTCNGEQEVVIPRRQLRKLIFEILRRGRWLRLNFRALFNYFVLNLLRKDQLRQPSQPCFEHGRNGVYIIEVFLVEQVDIEFWKVVNISVFK